MTQKPDPFHHHPELRGEIANSETSFFRDFSVDRLVEKFPQLERFRDFTHSDAKREALRAEALQGHNGDLWVFGYGSLMWDPALRYQEVRRVFAPQHARRLILKDDKGGRGTPEAPGLMAALDEGDGCDGLALRIAAEDVDSETEILFRRELVGPAYIAAFIPVELDGEKISALSFLADHTSPDIVPDVDRADQIRWIATGSGILGSSRDYLGTTITQLARMGIADEYCADLLKEVDSFLAASHQQETLK